MKSIVYRKTLCAVALLFVSVALLRGYCPRGTGINDAAVYFRDSGEYWLTGGTWNDLPYIYEERYFTEHKDRLVASGAVPGVTGLSQFDCYVRYDENDDVSVLRIQWSEPIGEDGRQPSISLAIWSIPPEESDVEGIFRIMESYPEAVTTTEVLGSTVYGHGTQDSQIKSLGVLLRDGSLCSIVGNWVSMEQMVQVLDHILLHGVSYSAFDIAKGDVYETVSGTLHKKFLPYIPDYEAVGMEKKGEDYYLAVNEAPRTTALHFGKQGYTVGWSIHFLPDESIMKNDLGQLTLLSKETLEETIQEEQPYYFGFWVEDVYIYVTLSRKNLLDRVWMLMESLEVSP